LPLHVSDALADTIALVLRDSTQDREHQLADAVAADIAAEIDHVQADAVLFELFKRSERIGRGTKCAIELCGNDNVASL